VDESSQSLYERHVPAGHFRGTVPASCPAGPGPGGHVIRVAESDDALEAYADVWTAVHSEAPISGDEVRRRAAELDDGRRYFVAEADGRAVGTGFASRTSVPGRAATLVSVLPVYRRRGIGSALLDASLQHARGLGATVAAGTLAEEALPWAERRGFEVFDREVELVRELSGDEVAGQPPEGIRILQLAAEHLDGAYEVFAEGVADIPATEPLTTTYERWHAEAAAAPLALVAIEGERVVGYAELERRTAEVLGHELTAVARTHRRRGIARALKQAQIAWAAERGFRRLLTDTHWANEATRRLNESLGYRPLPPRFMVRKELA
jgi:GNAT superfamily N-acetyltransferase